MTDKDFLDVLRIAGVQKVTFHPDGKFASVEFSAAALLDAVVSKSPLDEDEDRDLSAEQRRAKREARMQHFLYGGSAEDLGK